MAFRNAFCCIVCATLQNSLALQLTITKRLSVNYFVDAVVTFECWWLLNPFVRFLPLVGFRVTKKETGVSSKNKKKKPFTKTSTKITNKNIPPATLQLCQSTILSVSGC